MKARRFLAYIAAAVVSICFVVGCSDKDEPPMNPDIEDQEVRSPSYNDTIIYIDESSDEEREQLSGGLGMITFTEESLDGYRVVVTRKSSSGNYKIYIPSEGVELNLAQDLTYYRFGWFNVDDYCTIDKNSIEFTSENLGWYDKGVKNEKRYYFVKYNKYISITHDTDQELRFTIPANKLSEERSISVFITNDYENALAGVEMIFIQAGAEKK